MTHAQRMGLETLNPRLARFRPLKQEGSFLFRCSWPHPSFDDKLCPGALGIANDYDVNQHPLPTGNGEGSCSLDHPRDATGYQCVREGKLAVFGLVGKDGRKPGNTQYPINPRLLLPAVVLCSRCGRPNTVRAPSLASRS